MMRVLKLYLYFPNINEFNDNMLKIIYAKLQRQSFVVGTQFPIINFDSEIQTNDD